MKKKGFKNWKNTPILLHIRIICYRIHRILVANQRKIIRKTRRRKRRRVRARKLRSRCLKDQSVHLIFKATQWWLVLITGRHRFITTKESPGKSSSQDTQKPAITYQSTCSTMAVDLPKTNVHTIPWNKTSKESRSSSTPFQRWIPGKNSGLILKRWSSKRFKKQWPRVRMKKIKRKTWLSINFWANSVTYRMMGSRSRRELDHGMYPRSRSSYPTLTAVMAIEYKFNN